MAAFPCTEFVFFFDAVTDEEVAAWKDQEKVISKLKKFGVKTATWQMELPRENSKKDARFYVRGFMEFKKMKRMDEVKKMFEKMDMFAGVRVGLTRWRMKDAKNAFKEKKDVLDGPFVFE